MSSSTVEKIKERLSITDVISSYLTLEKAGRNLKARCPFHSERTPSFFVSPERDSYYCFGCSRGGDIFNFVQEFEGLDFLGSLKLLAERSGVPVESLSPPAALKERERLFSALEKATEYYEKARRENPQVLNYLKSRGLNEETLDAFRVGFAPPEWQGVLRFLENSGFRAKEMEDTGLVVRGRTRSFDRFRSRIMFPIADLSGRVVGFSGRIFEEEPVHKDTENIPRSSPEAAEGAAKYINSPETELYHKSKVLYGMDKAKMAIRQEDRCILVEGQIDVLSAHQAGTQNAVAVSGTSLGEEHLKTIGRFTKNIVFAFDSDAAGLRASGRGVDAALEEGFTVSLISLPSGKDPADLIKEDKKAWEHVLESARHIIDFYLLKLREREQDDYAYRKKVEKIVLPYISRIGSKIEQAHFVAKVAEALNLDEEPIWEAMKQYVSQTRSAPQQTGTATRSAFQKTGIASRSSYNDIRRKGRLSVVQEKIAGILLLKKHRKIATKDDEEKFKKITENDFKEYFKTLSKEEQNHALFEADLYYENAQNMEAALRELFFNFEKESLKIKLTETMNALRRAERASDEKHATELLKVCSEISQKINDLAKS